MRIVDGQLVFKDEIERRAVLNCVTHPDFKLVERAFECMADEAKMLMCDLTGLDKSPFEAGRQLGRLQVATDWFQTVMKVLKEGLLESELNELKCEPDMLETEQPRVPRSVHAE